MSEVTGLDYRLEDAPIVAADLQTDQGAYLRQTRQQGAAEFSSEQQKAITVVGNSVVSAGAGSGKTSVLVERYLRLLIDDPNLSTNKILAITFTDNAATQMRQRLRSRMDDLAVGALNDGHMQSYGQRWDLDVSWIGTFHSIAVRILRRWGVSIGIDPDVGVLDELQSAQQLAAAFERGFARLCMGDDSQLAEQLVQLAARNSVRTLQADTIALHNLRRSQGLVIASAEDHQLLPEPELKKPDHLSLLNRLKAANAAALSSVELAVDDKPTDAGKKVLAAITAIGQRVGQITAGQLTCSALAELVDLMKSDVSARSPVAKLPAVEELRLQIDQTILSVAADELDGVGRSELHARRRLLVACAAEYESAKRQLYSIDFDDQMLQLLALLRRRKDISERLKSQFDHVLVDEFQDTNPLQLQILELLSRPEARFQVGDRLQAIYSFRHATTEGFDLAKEQAGKEGNVALAQTHRCSSELISMINRVGSAAHDEYQPLVGGHPGTTVKDLNQPATELHLIPTPPSKALDEGTPVSERETEAITELIKRLINTDGWRPDQIAVLARKASPLLKVQNALAAEGIRAAALKGQQLLDSLEAKELSSWLSALINPYDDLALTAALRLPISSFAAVDLVRLASFHRSIQPRQPLWLSAQRFAESGGESAELLAELIRLLKQQREHLIESGPASVLRKLLDNGKLKAAVAKRPDGHRRLAVIERYLAWVADLELQTNSLTQLQAAFSGKAGAAPTFVEPADKHSLTLSTIHAAKGLEWPVVIVCDLGSREKADTDKLRLGLTPDDGRIGLSYKRSGLRLVKGSPTSGVDVPLWNFDQLKSDAGRLQAQESRRLFHVAMTRAEQKLLLVGRVATCESKESADISVDLSEGKMLSPEQHDQQPTAPPLAWILPTIFGDLAMRNEFGQLPSIGEAAVVQLPESASPQVDLQVAVGQLPGLEVDEELATELAHCPTTAASSDERVVTASPSALPAISLKGLDSERLVAAHAVALQRQRSGAGNRDTVSFSSLQTSRSGVAVDDRSDGAEDSPSGDSEHEFTSSLVHVDGTKSLQLKGKDLGNLVHRVLEDRFRLLAKQPLPVTAAGASPLTESEIETSITRQPTIFVSGQVDHASVVKQVADVANRLLASPTVVDALATTTTLYSERDFVFELKPELPLFNGQIDLWLEQPNQLQIIDWKTNKLEAGQTTQQLFDHSYSLQSLIYGLVGLKAGFELVTVNYLFSDDVDEPINNLYVAADLTTYVERLASQVV